MRVIRERQGRSQEFTFGGLEPMASAEREPITGVQGAEPRWGVRGAKPPEAEGKLAPEHTFFCALLEAFYTLAAS